MGLKRAICFALIVPVVFASGLLNLCLCLDDGHAHSHDGHAQEQQASHSHAQDTHSSGFSDLRNPDCSCADLGEPVQAVQEGDRETRVSEVLAAQIPVGQCPRSDLLLPKSMGVIAARPPPLPPLRIHIIHSVFLL